MRWPRHRTQWPRRPPGSAAQLRAGSSRPHLQRTTVTGKLVSMQVHALANLVARHTAALGQHHMTQAAPGQSLACAGQRHGSRNGCPGRAPASKAGRHSGKEHDAGGQGLEDRPAGSLLQQPGSQQCNHGARCGAHRLDQGRRPVNGKERHKRPKAHNRGPVCGQECGACREARSGEGLVRLQAAAAAGPRRRRQGTQQRCSRWASPLRRPAGQGGRKQRLSPVRLVQERFFSCKSKAGEFWPSGSIHNSPSAACPWARGTGPAARGYIVESIWHVRVACSIAKILLQKQLQLVD